nr:MAG TPA: desulfoferrodoxin-like protein [Caudoviricetes sp.]
MQSPHLFYLIFPSQHKTALKRERSVRFFILGEFYICPVCQTFIIPLYAG